MQTVTSSRNIGKSSRCHNAEEIRAAFYENSRELMWLAGFLTGNDFMASACVLDAYTLTQSAYQIGQDWLWTWPRDATIRSTLDLFRVRIALLASVHESRSCFHRQHAPLSADAIEWVTNHSDDVRLRLDVLCRFVLILCGIEERDTVEAALVLGVSREAVEAAYCAVLESLEVMTCEEILESNGGAAAFN